MLVKKGRNRIVLVLSGVAIKFPLLHLRTVHKLLRSWQKNGSQYIKQYWNDTPIHALKYWLFVGVGNNWREFTFYWRTRHPLLRPTYCSILGLVNIQRAGNPIVERNEYDFAHQMLDLLGSSGLWIDDIHHFTNPENFCFNNGRIQIFDYGSRLTQKVIGEVGTKILNGFDPNYKRVQTDRSGQERSL